MSDAAAPQQPETPWGWPGSRWWKFDFHTHTPASLCQGTSSWRNAIGTPNEVTPEKWLLQYMAAGIDCVAITDHNSGAWVDKLKDTNEHLKREAAEGRPAPNYHDLAIFPGVELSVNGGGVHLLVVFERGATSNTVTSLLGAVGFPAHLHGRTDSDDEAAVTRLSMTQVVEEVLRVGGIPIPAHANGPKGLLQCKPDATSPVQGKSTIQQILGESRLLAVEWTDAAVEPPMCVRAETRRLARVVGSDCHNFRNGHVPGSRYTWVKMAQPTLEGLRLALLDGNNVSLRRVEDGRSDSFRPFRLPPHVIRTIEVEGARAMGHGKPARIECSPFFNAIVGGRGTGKSTLVHALRLATGRGEELPASGEPRRQFEAFQTISRGRNSEGAVLPGTTIRIEWQHDEDRLRLCWSAGAKAIHVEQWQGDAWLASASQAVNASRFPIRILSQGQIAAMASGARGGLLAIVDEAGNVALLKKAFDEARRTFLAQRARLREVDGQLGALPEVERKLAEATRKLQTLARAGHAQVLTEYAASRRQLRIMKATFEQLAAEAAKVAALPDELVLDDWPANHFDADKDADVLTWRHELDAKLKGQRDKLQAIAAGLSGMVETEKADSRVKAWGERARAAAAAHETLQKQLAEQGVDDPQAFERLTQERLALEEQRKVLEALQRDRASIIGQIEAQLALLKARRDAITTARQGFIQRTISENPHVRMSVVPMGFDAEVIERELRALLGVEDERFADDILHVTEGEAPRGLACELACDNPGEHEAALTRVKDRLLHPDERIGGRLRNYLGKQQPEFIDRVEAWFPEDDLRIEYQRQGKWHSIREGSQGQRSAALLAFLLAFGTEPIVLDQPEDDLDNHLIYELIVGQIRQNKLQRQLIVVTHNANVVVNGDAELVHVMDFRNGQCLVKQSGALQEEPVREEVCRVMEGGHEAFSRRWKRLGKEV